ncbi:SHOCT domain-containing protein [Nocardioides sp. LHG3406-4]|uniref:SHOCT domain-containing protein n=1 Tax=Nocardioides sp. LHG3406-4 TaxID=2804575 RepID=UPI003CF12F03
MSLLRGIARTAVISGTATAVSGRVARRQAARFAEDDARTAVLRQRAYQEQVGQAPPSATPSTDDVITQLRALADLKAQGILTDDEFQEQKARILAR